MTCKGEEDAMGIQKINGECIAVLGKGEATSVDYVNSEQREKGFKLTYSNGDKCEIGPRKITHLFRCSEDIDFEIEDVLEMGYSCNYEVIWRSKYACKVY